MMKTNAILKAYEGLDKEEVFIVELQKREGYFAG